MAAGIGFLLATLRTFTVWTIGRADAALLTTLAPLTRPCAVKARLQVEIKKILISIIEITPGKDGFAFLHGFDKGDDIDEALTTDFDVGDSVVFDPATHGIGSGAKPLGELLL